MTTTSAAAAMGYVLHFIPGEPVPPVELVGGKAHNLARLANAGALVPPWVVVTADAFRDLAVAAGEARVPAALLADLEGKMARAGLRGRRLAVRSSAVAEDGSVASFAGQFATRLGVRAADLPAAIAEVWASAATLHARVYGGAISPMAVIVQAMVDADVAGVAFGADPVSGERGVAVINSVYGLGEGLVSGELSADTHRVRLDGDAARVRTTLAHKAERIRLRREGGTLREALPEEIRGSSATLSDDEVVAIARVVLHLEGVFGAPQDVEWAIERGAGRQLYLLQARPITALPAGPAGERRVWDNSNIIESYPGITSPLTYSFVRAVYEEVYRQFCAVVGVSRAQIERHRHVFANMVGLVRGRVYYNLLNWYRTLALLPGYALNRPFMERMMGVRESLEEPPPAASSGARLRDLGRVIRMTASLVAWNQRLRYAVPAFHARVERAIGGVEGQDLAEWQIDDLAALYRKLEGDLLRNWQVPLVNDFFAMLWFGVLGRLVEQWLPDHPPTLVNDLLAHEGGLVSAEPAMRLRELAASAAAAPAVLAHFTAEPDDAALAARIASDPACVSFQRAVEAYLARFGDRCIGELKLETVPLRDDPAFLYQSIRASLAAGGPPTPEAPPDVREEAEGRVRVALGGWRRWAFGAALAQTRARVRDRENLRFERTRVFGAVRRIVLGIGSQLVAAGTLTQTRDIFFLRLEEIFGHLDGTGTTADLRALVELRRAEWARYEAEPAPPDRFESYGPVDLGRWSRPAPRDATSGDPDARSLSGTGCCPGVVRAPVRLVRDPRDAGDLAGHILVAERTDPGWVLLFPLARGLLVERGSLLSHSAIVAREMALPCIVGLAGAMTQLRDGEWVEMDGTSGIVRRLDD